MFPRYHKMPKGKTIGGVAILGWSLGATYALAAFGNIEKLESGSRERLSRYVRALIHDAMSKFATHSNARPDLILHDPPSVCLGLPPSKDNWFPALDPTIPQDEAFEFGLWWLTVYFDHPGNALKRDLNNLSYALPSASRVPSIFSIYPQYNNIVCTEPVLRADGIGTMEVLKDEIRENYEKALFGNSCTAKDSEEELHANTGIREVLLH
jgi:hypothetical protein